MNDRSLLLDYDGVIADTDQWNQRSLKDAAARIGLSFCSADFHEFFAGRNLRDATRAYLQRHHRAARQAEFLAAKTQWDQRYLSFIAPYPATLDFIRTRSQRAAMALVTGSRRVLIDQFLAHYQLADAFCVLVTAEDMLPERGKPHPDPYLLALGRLGVPAKNALAIEDSPAGIQAAKHAGMECLAPTQTHEAYQLREADWVMADLTDAKMAQLPIHPLSWPANSGVSSNRVTRPAP